MAHSQRGVTLQSNCANAKVAPSHQGILVCFLLAKVAGYGGNSPAQLDRLTCDQVKALPGAKRRINRAWPALRFKNTNDGAPLQVNQLSQWVRDLLQDGDVEPNPGPTIKMATINLQTAGNTWTLLLNLAGKNLDVVLLQETHFSPKEQEAFGRYAVKKGYRF